MAFICLIFAEFWFFGILANPGNRGQVSSALSLPPPRYFPPRNHAIMLVEVRSVGAPPDLPASFRRALIVVSASPLPSLQVDKLLKNGFLRELVLALGAEPCTSIKGLKKAAVLDALHPALLFGDVALRPTFVYMFRHSLDFGVLVPHGFGQWRVHPDLVASLAALRLRRCPSCSAHVLHEETTCWMCEANEAIAPTIEGFRGVQRLREPTVLTRAVVVPPNGLPVNAVSESVVRMEVPVGSLLVATSGEDGAIIRYFRIFAGEHGTSYVRVIRSGIYDFVSCVSATEILAEFSTVPPGFLSWIDFPGASE